ncbi:carbohydrate ABC transporter permease [Oceanobacillus polygoni]|uniref:Sn-glycerol 3-phosphate transport system permease protein n=1 Tax=Oceanobacillus polygoni TaxID=1235259 RepID=A0A9X0YZT7_9BACI|nr:sugar ABC transporter permease [Oceanobacillus polygoni]MBP2079595.1 sn-glycerol 3-phosphate transport system permease protein [Oceanobacillus polygoni]
MRSVKWRPYLFVAPAIIVFLVFFIQPIFYMIYLSFHDWNFISPDKTFVGLGNFKELLSDPMFLEVIRNTLMYTFFTVLFSISIALLMSIWLNKQGWMYSFVQGAVFSPHIISLVSIAMLWMWIMDADYGLLNWVLSLVGLEKVPWLTDPNTALSSLIIIAVWKNIGYFTLIIIAGLQSIPKHLYEAAALDRTPPWRRFAKITFPMLSPSLFFLTIIGILDSIKVFETISIITKGGPLNSTNTLVYYIYENGFIFFKIGYASAAGVILLVILSILTLLYFKVLSKRVHYQ